MLNEQENAREDGVLSSLSAPSGACVSFPDMRYAAFQPFNVKANSSSLSPIFRTFQSDEDQLDR